MNTSQINAYVSPIAYHEGKQESVFPRFHEDLAILDPANEYTPIAARGLTLKPDKKLNIPSEELKFMNTHLHHREMVAIGLEDGILIAFNQLYASVGVIPVILPHGSQNDVAYALGEMGTQRLICSPAVTALAAKHSKAEDVYRHLTDLLFLCREIFSPSSQLDFRLHSARVAHLAGCKANVTEFPVGNFPISHTDLCRWTAFLLCVFLTLRGDSSVGTLLHLEHADLREFSLKLSHQSEYTRKTPISEAILQFLSLPAFGDFRLTRSKNQFTIEAQLQRLHASHLLQSPNSVQMPLILQIVLE